MVASTESESVFIPKSLKGVRKPQTSRMGNFSMINFSQRLAPTLEEESRHLLKYYNLGLLRDRLVLLLSSKNMFNDISFVDKSNLDSSDNSIHTIFGSLKSPLYRLLYPTPPKSLKYFGSRIVSKFAFLLSCSRCLQIAR